MLGTGNEYSADTAYDKHMLVARCWGLSPGFKHFKHSIRTRITHEMQRRFPRRARKVQSEISSTIQALLDVAFYDLQSFYTAWAPRVSAFTALDSFGWL